MFKLVNNDKTLNNGKNFLKCQWGVFKIFRGDLYIYINSGFDEIKTDCLYLPIRSFLTLRYIVKKKKNFVTNLTVLNSKFINISL